MKNPFSLDKGMEALEQGANIAKQQVKTTAQSTQGQVTGQTPSQNPSSHPSQSVDSVKEQLLGVKKTEDIKLDTFQGQITGMKTERKPQGDEEAQALSQQAAKKENDSFIQDLYGPSKGVKPPTQEEMAKKSQDDSDKQQAIKNQLQFVRTDIEDKMTELRHRRVEEKVEEEHVEEQQKMQDLQIEEKKKDEDIVLQRKKTNIENKAPGAG